MRIWDEEVHSFIDSESVAHVRNINGIEYDTRVARRLGKRTNGKGGTFAVTVSDACYYEEVLYQMPTGEYFVVGIGNSKSSYPHSIVSAGVLEPVPTEWAAGWLAGEFGEIF